VGGEKMRGRKICGKRGNVRGMNAEKEIRRELG